ncbi:hypothetical protein [Flavobacterium sp.]|uniref:hypothetical protein n=1 Tax=Flavobacterium sp. TaxID=239 RepID=UPI002610CDB2|nr:hypothetical protein [Flavobacterium sp.]
MDALDKLKSDWKKNEGKYPRFSEKDIYAMLHKRSSSIVKWILMISVLEFIFWLGLSFLLRDSSQVKKVNSFNIQYITIPLEVINYIIILFFVGVFYKNYKKIKVTDNVRNLMQNILHTKRAVTYYIFSIIIYMLISIITIFILFFNYDPDLIKLVHESEVNGNLAKFYAIYISLALVGTAVILLVFWLFYKLLYGLLLKRLHRNYEELKKLDL